MHIQSTGERTCFIEMPQRKGQVEGKVMCGMVRVKQDLEIQFVALGNASEATAWS